MAVSENKKKITLNHPHPDHTPSVGRRPSGGGRAGQGRFYSTTLTCSCGWAPRVETSHYQGRTRVRRNDVVTNEAPTAGGRSSANHAYQRHVLMALSFDSPDDYRTHLLEAALADRRYYTHTGCYPEDVKALVDLVEESP